MNDLCRNNRRNMMILLTVRMNDMKGQQEVKSDAFKQAWFRLTNEDTN